MSIFMVIVVYGIDCGFNRSVQHIVRIVVPGCHSLAFFLVERSVDSPPRQAGLASSPTDRAPSGNTV